MRIDPNTTMASEVAGDILTVVYPHREWPGSRQAAGTLARQYGRDRRAFARFLDVTRAGHVETYRYRLILR